MTDPTCYNCTYETDSVTETHGFCQTCDRAYQIGYRDAENDYSVELKQPC